MSLNDVAGECNLDEVKIYVLLRRDLFWQKQQENVFNSLNTTLTLFDH